MLTDAEIAFLRARLDEDEARAQAALEEWDDEGTRSEWEDLPDASFAHARWHNPARVLREVTFWRRLLLEYQTAPLDAVYGGKERETGFRLMASAALKAKIATYDGNPVTGELFPAACG